MPGTLAMSPPARGRGLKPLVEMSPEALEVVAPRAGAWIETATPALSVTVLASPPARGRGLKRRGDGGRSTWCRVAPRAGAWIETT